MRSVADSWINLGAVMRCSSATASGQCTELGPSIVTTSLYARVFTSFDVYSSDTNNKFGMKCDYTEINIFSPGIVVIASTFH